MNLAMTLNNAETLYVVCDANATSGMGHFMRCVSLASALKSLNFDTVFLGDFSPIAQRFAEHFSQKLQLTTASIITRIASLAVNSQVLIDSYAYSTTHLPNNYRYILIDDFCQQEVYPVKGVINFTLKANNYNYVSKGAQHQALGTDYYLPHPAIVGLNLPAVVAIKRLLIMIGSGDTNNLSAMMFDMVSAIDPSIEIKIVATKTQEAALTGIPTECLIRPTPEVDSLYRWADLCITSGGLAKYELAYLAKPAAVYPLTEDEAVETNQFSDAGLCFNLIANGNTKAEIINTLQRVLTSSSLRLSAHQRCLQVFSQASALNTAYFVQQCLRGN